MKPRISMVTLGVDDLERAVDFYQNGLGLPKMDSPPSVAFFNLNGTWLGLYGRKDLAEDAGVEYKPGEYNSVTLSHNVESNDEVDQVFAELCAAGAKPIKEPQDVFWGGYHAYVADPDGHLWEIAHNPFEWVGPKDE